MKFFIDTANLEQIKEAQALGVLDGVTTNPSLMAKEGIAGKENIMNHYLKICEIVDGAVSAEVISTDYEGIIREGEELAALNPQIVVKVPIIKDGIKAIKYFSSKGIRTTCTLVFSVGQALLAAKAGATYVSPFTGRLDDNCTDGLQLIGDIVDMYQRYGFKTQVLAASIRHTMHIIGSMQMGADVATCPLNAILGLLKHPLTDAGLQKFLEDYHKLNK
jgi:transaldolase